MHRFTEHSLTMGNLTDNFKNHHKDSHLKSNFILYKCISSLLNHLIVFSVKKPQCSMDTKFIIIQVQIANFLNHLNDESDYV